MSRVNKKPDINKSPKELSKGKIIFEKEHPTDKVYRVHHNPRQIGPVEFSFDKKKIYNLWQDYPDNMTPEEVEIFDREQPFWADFFKDRKEGK